MQYIPATIIRRTFNQINETLVVNKMKLEFQDLTDFHVFLSLMLSY